MADLLKVVLDKFQRPLVLVFVLLGAALLLRATVFERVSFAGLAGGPLTDTARLLTGGVGLALIACAVWVDQHGSAGAGGPASSEEYPDDLRQPLWVRRANVSGKQEDILRYVTQKTRTSGGFLSEEELATKFSQSRTEVYYRMEQLRLLGLVEKQRVDGNNVYKLSRALAEHITHGNAPYHGSSPASQ